MNQTGMVGVGDEGEDERGVQASAALSTIGVS